MRPLNALVFDDDPAMLLLLRRILQARGYAVHTYESPAESPLYQCRSCPCSLQPTCPDLIISDYDMPIVNGVELLESAMRKGCRCRHLAIISGKRFVEIEADFSRVEKYKTRYFIKPPDLDNLSSWFDRVKYEVAECRVA